MKIKNVRCVVRKSTKGIKWSFMMAILLNFVTIALEKYKNCLRKNGKKDATL